MTAPPLSVIGGLARRIEKSVEQRSREISQFGLSCAEMDVPFVDAEAAGANFGDLRRRDVVWKT